MNYNFTTHILRSELYRWQDILQRKEAIDEPELYEYLEEEIESAKKTIEELSSAIELLTSKQ